VSRKEDFDLERGVWTKPSHQTKQKRTEHLPLSAQALALVASIIEASDTHSSFLFPGNKPGQPLREIKKFWSAALHKADITDYRRHDNRHTYASHLVSSGLSLEVIGRLLEHTYYGYDEKALRPYSRRSVACRHRSVRIKDCRFPKRPRRTTAFHFAPGLNQGQPTPKAISIKTTTLFARIGRNRGRSMDAAELAFQSPTYQAQLYGAADPGGGRSSQAVSLRKPINSNTLTNIRPAMIPVTVFQS